MDTPADEQGFDQPWPIIDTSFSIASRCIPGRTDE